MIILTGNNLGERQRELNAKVKEAVANHVHLEDTTEESDVDKLFKIDLAAKYANIDYIIEVLKSGDSLYISRALKCGFIYGDNHSNIINPENLQNNVIPFMSSKMKKKLLTAISAHVRNESRAAEFYTYCMDIKLKAIALKFLNCTTDKFKLEALEDNSKRGQLPLESGTKYLKNLIGFSFTLAEAYLEAYNIHKKMQVFRGLRYLYTVSGEKYLDFLEKHQRLIEKRHYKKKSCLGSRISRSIMKHHKDRVLKNPSLYVEVLSKTPLAKYSTAEDAKIYLAALLPYEARDFWHENFCRKYEYILNKIVVGKFPFVKQIFTAKYPGEQFETTVDFSLKHYHRLMTAEEKETWALKELGIKISVVDKDYQWFEYVSFEKAFEEIKKLVFITMDNTKREEMMIILADVAKNQRDVEKLMKYYYERHVNEQKSIKENFLDRVMQNFNVFEFDEDCWTAFNNLFHNLEVYSMTDYNSKTEYRTVALIYSIINQKDVAKAIENHIKCELQLNALKMNTDKLTKEQQEMVFNYLFKLYLDEIKKYEQEPYEEVKYSLRKYIHSILDVLFQFKRTKEDCPELVMKFVKLDWAKFKCHTLICDGSDRKITRTDLLRDLKKDAKLLVGRLPHVKLNIESSHTFNISTVLKKLKVYFPNDVAKDYLKFYDTILTQEQLWHKTSQAAAHGIFQLGDEKFKVNFMEKYAPEAPVINHSEVDQKLLRIQQAICAHACYSRPPVPLKSMLMYIKGDYVQFCLPTFQSYLANLPLPLCMEFVEAILDTPVSTQKHGIRLAFECFNAESLNTLVLRVWENTKNVSLRMIIYKAIYNKISQVSSGQDLLFDTLKKLTLTLHPDDDEQIFRLLISRQLPEHFMLECIEMAWKIRSHFPPKSTSLWLMRQIIMCIRDEIDTFRQEFVRGVIDEFIASVFIHDEECSSEGSFLIDEKWKLTATYIINVKSNEEIGKKKELTKQILKKCLDTQDTGIHERKRSLLKTCFSFINDLENKSYSQYFDRYENVNLIMQLVLETLEETLAIEEIYMEVWEIRLGIVARKVIIDSKIRCGENIGKRKLKDIANNLAYELGLLVKEFVDKDLFFVSFLKAINRKIISKTQKVKNLMNSEVTLADMMTNVCLGLLSFEVTQIYILVLNILPASCDSDYEEEFKAVIKKFDKMNNKEIRCNLYSKLANLGCDNRGNELKARIKAHNDFYAEEFYSYIDSIE